ncbi:class I SAM-dependent methyltransferase [Polycladomyces subterraneus]|uniref:Class I SAM-dependent methyltransferase n=1 Tax=Polycladomyces subterraneus TaxID=1016997 RepID=A0ABT8IKW4_9BACL|nr:class I SAM-dependent methyltransferase [Polycladomyces subterraneus]MDN4593433.1 class I SAM-dependent methyltransferase [Polycladomyces subterraneus]
MAAAGGKVTVLDISENQLRQDRFVAEREGLSIRTVKGDMTNLEAFCDEEFDLIIHPVSNLFVKDIQKVWNEIFRVLKQGGTLISGFMNPVFFDWEL